MIRDKRNQEKVKQFVESGLNHWIDPPLLAAMPSITMAETNRSKSATEKGLTTMKTTKQMNQLARKAGVLNKRMDKAIHKFDLARQGNGDCQRMIAMIDVFDIAKEQANLITAEMKKSGVILNDRAQAMLLDFSLRVACDEDKSEEAVHSHLMAAMEAAVAEAEEAEAA